MGSELLNLSNNTNLITFIDFKKELQEELQRGIRNYQGITGGITAKELQDIYGRHY